MTGLAEEHTLISRDFFAKAEEALARNGLLQASEKGWGAAVHLVKGIAQSKGWQNDGHRELYQAVNRLAQEAGDSDIRIHFDSASALHSNFYEDWMPREMIESSLAQVRIFLQRLQRLP